jgi:hypothetical protein
MKYARVKFYVFSDNLDWGKRHLGFLENYMIKNPRSAARIFSSLNAH